VESSPLPELPEWLSLIVGNAWSEEPQRSRWLQWKRRLLAYGVDPALIRVEGYPHRPDRLNVDPPKGGLIQVAVPWDEGADVAMFRALQRLVDALDRRKKGLG